MEKKSQTKTVEPIKLERAFTTLTLYLDASIMKKLFFTRTYNFEAIPGEEFLVKLWEYTDAESSVPVNRIIFLSGSEPHVPIYRTRVHYDPETKDLRMSHHAHPGTKVEYTNYNNETTAITRISRGTFFDAANRGVSTRGELTKDMAKFGFTLVEREKKRGRKDPQSLKTQDKLPTTGVVIRSSTPAKEAKPSIPNKQEVQQDIPSSLVDPPYFTDALMKALGPSIRSRPIRVEPELEGYTLISSNIKDINKYINNRLTPENQMKIQQQDYSFVITSRKGPEPIIVFDETNLNNPVLYEGDLTIRIPTCSYSGLRFAVTIS